MKRASIALAAALLASGLPARAGAEGREAPDLPAPRLFERAWTVPIEESGAIQVVPVPGGFVVAAPSGRLTRIAGADGTVAWRGGYGSALSGEAVLLPGGEQGWIAAPLADGSIGLAPLDGGDPARWAPGPGPWRLSAVGSRLLAVSPEGEARLYDPGSASEAWRRRLLPAAAAPAVVCGDRLVVGFADGHIAALDPETGEVLWQKNLGSPMEVAPWCDATHAVAATRDNMVHSLRLWKGRAGFRWRVRVGSDPAGPPLVAGRTTFVLSLDTHLYGFHERSGHLLFRTRLGRRPGPAAVSRGFLLVAGAHATRMDAFRVDGGRSAGGFELPEGMRFLVGPVASGDMVAAAVARYGGDSSLVVALRPAPVSKAPEPAPGPGSLY